MIIMVGPLLPSVKENGVNRRKEVPSRYMSLSNSCSSSNSSSSSCCSSSISRRYESPVVTRNDRSLGSDRRSQSVDRKRSKNGGVVGNAGDVSGGDKVLVTSRRSFCVSFQGEAFSLPVSKARVVSQGGGGGGGSVRRVATPEKRRGGGIRSGSGSGSDSSTPLRGSVDGVEYSSLSLNHSCQHRWPARMRKFDMVSRNLDCFDSENRVLNESLLDESRRASFSGILDLESGNGDVLNGIRASFSGILNVNSLNDSSVPSDRTASDTDSVSSGSTSGGKEMRGGLQERNLPRGIVDSAKLWKETNMRLRRLQDHGLGLSSNPSSKFVTPPRLSQSRKYSEGPMSSPIRSAVRAASPSKVYNTPASASMRGVSPSRVRSSIGSSPWDKPSVLSFVVDVRRGTVGENLIVEAHQLRLLYNTLLQWRFVNARADAALSVQRQNAEKNLWNAWITVTALRDSVRYKRTQVQLLRQKLKLSSILRGQIAYLEEWALLDNDHSNFMRGAIEALKACTLRLPVVGRATANIQSVKEAVVSAVDVLQSMASSTCSLLTKVEKVNSLVAELSKVAAKERILLGKCKEVLSMLAAMQIKDCSLRTHILQLNQ